MNWKFAVVAFSLLSLCGCGPSAKERAKKFGERCAVAGFTAKQCELLFAMAEEERSDSEENGLLAGFAVGMAATAKR